MLIPPDPKVIDEVDGTPPEYELDGIQSAEITKSLSLTGNEEEYFDEESDDEPPEAIPVASTSSVPLHGPAVSFHIYKGPGYFNGNAVIKSEDKERVEYYFEHPRKFNTFDLSLHVGSKTGPVIATMFKKGIFRKNHIFNITMLKDGFSTEVKFNFVGIVHRFLDRDGKKMMWKNDAHALTGDWVCRNEDNPLDIAARWRRTLLARKKQGKLNIMPNYVDQTDLILATGLAVEEWAREIRRQRASG